ncbi:MAG: hypothetical protein QOF61_36 [Acidobacteriota bacterium]|nr:hypothetical protein [Acidobacteriota bacterium]
MKVSSLSCAAALWLALACVLAGCGSKPEPSTTSDSSGAGGRAASGQPTAQGGKAGDAALDEAGRIMAEAIKRRAAPSGSPRTPAEAVLGATPTPTLGARLGVAGQPFTSFDGRFIVTPPPGFPAFERSTNLLSDGKIELHLFRSEFPGGSAAIIVGYNDLSESAANRPPQELLEKTRDGALKEVNGTLESQENLTVKGRPALSAYISITDQPSGKQVYCRWECVLQPRRAYYLCYTTTDRAELNRQEVEAFFQSFVLLD